jgi:hypothetical protein
MKSTAVVKQPWSFTMMTREEWEKEGNGKLILIGHGANTEKDESGPSSCCSYTIHVKNKKNQRRTKENKEVHLSELVELKLKL